MQVDLNSAIAQRIYKLKLDTTTSILMGNYKSAIKASKELAEIGVDNFELTTKVPAPVKGSLPLFSKFGWNTLKFMIINSLRIKTPAEKKFKQLVQLYKQGNIKF